VLKSRTELLENPDGHGGFLKAFVGSGLAKKMIEQGRRYLVYNQVDNILALYDDPVLVGLAEQEQADLVLKVVKKVTPDEKMGNLATIKGKPTVIEYTDLTEEHTRLTTSSGRPLLEWGSTAMYCFRIEFLECLYREGFEPPIHRSKKPLQAWIGGECRTIEGYKNERFLHDLLLAPTPVRVVALALPERDREFAPVKNLKGVDSAETARTLASQEFHRWIRAAGLTVSGEVIEISPYVAGHEREFVERYCADRGSIAVTERDGQVLIAPK
jgi:UDP-N-acetylglucosamine/UDP-N-acetylgalactosamine diphosphorylase